MSNHVEYDLVDSGGSFNPFTLQTQRLYHYLYFKYGFQNTVFTMKINKLRIKFRFTKDKKETTINKFKFTR